jgi:hypothetical protein
VYALLPITAYVIRDTQSLNQSHSKMIMFDSVFALRCIYRAFKRAEDSRRQSAKFWDMTVNVSKLAQRPLLVYCVYTHSINRNIIIVVAHGCFFKKQGFGKRHYSLKRSSDDSEFLLLSAPGKILCVEGVSVSK